MTAISSTRCGRRPGRCSTWRFPNRASPASAPIFRSSRATRPWSGRPLSTRRLKRPKSSEPEMTRNITDALGLAARVHAGLVSAETLAPPCVSDTRARHPALNCFTAVLADQARAEAAAIDARLRTGAPVGPLAGVPFAVKNLFDIEGLTTLAGSKILAGRPVATKDASVVRRLRAAGAGLV